MKSIKYIICVTLLLSSCWLFGQQDPQYSQYNYNMNVINPAYAGSKGVLSIGVLGRSQWVGLEGAPRTLTLSVNSPVGKSVGLGLSLIADRVGPVVETNLFGDFSYTITTSENSRLAFGIKAGLTSLQVRNLSSNSSNDPLNVPVDKTAPNFGAGAYYYTDKFYAGFSIPNFLKTRYLEKSGGIVSTASEKMHFFLTSGYVFDLYDNLKFKPSTLIRGVKGAPVSVDISANLLWQEKFEFGLSYRFDKSFSGVVGFLLNDNMRIGYSYDQSISNFGNFNFGSHEIMLLIDFNRQKLKSPRFF
ncbi:type IX secretion system membrane protein PorP/SprF [Polaribacter aestuariivivens]|uniref:Type IX secretion system membrane protein PorP/SprF n=1 Tax=Polaribacter aestuariivivens TaxID=2304626 RepID=A0A5S3N5G1_9FLAO|nr:type IX secretion system membrane protein PorP/SprF [Polaribacter aestuariivivens]TMM30337.1 type IX secretion system membrane protein PorP/SprF [Polaribacter aestuariivivens]